MLDEICVRKSIMEIWPKKLAQNSLAENNFAEMEFHKIDTWTACPRVAVAPCRGDRKWFSESSCPSLGLGSTAIVEVGLEQLPAPPSAGTDKDLKSEKNWF
jgi:hypothetical protein